MSLRASRLTKLVQGVVCLAVICVIGVAASASTASKAPVLHPKVMAVSAFTIRASNGYLVHVFGAGLLSDSVTVYFQKPGRPASVAIYSVRGKVTFRGIRANLGPVGKIALRFHPSRRIERLDVCGQKVRLRLGTYVGHLRLEGEEGFSSVRAHRIRGDLRPAVGLFCRDPGVWSGPPGAVLDLEGSPVGKSSVGLEAVKTSAHGPTRIDVGIREQRGRVSIVRRVGLIAPANAFRYGGGGFEASLAPPSPFSGTANFLGERPPGIPSSVTGDLRVDLPGRRGVVLTGDGLRGELQRRGQREISSFSAGESNVP
jgi:hypothetical protein